MDPHDEVAFREFVAARTPALLHTARLLTGNGHAAEDLLQEALTRLAGHWPTVTSPEAYTRTTMHRLQISRWRRLGVLREEPASQLPEQIQHDGR
jgi:DNA-directed RNA polymerase specialized sigma24 family protein